jgi:hypothetical protein
MNATSMTNANNCLFPAPLAVAADMYPRWQDGDLSFDEAANRLVTAHRDDGRARDQPIMDLRTWGLVPCEQYLALAPMMGHAQPHLLRGNAYSQLATRLGAPVEFVRDKLPAPLQLATLNYLLVQSREPMSAILRMRNNEVSALISTRYAPLDAEELVDNVREALVAHGLLNDVRVKSLASGLTDVLRIVLPAKTVATSVGDVTALGLDVSTSSFGRSAVHVRGLLWRLKCTNGLGVSEKLGGFSVRHVGDSQRLRDGIREAIPTVLAHATGAMDPWRRAVTLMVDDVQRQVEQLRELNISEQKGVLDELKSELGVRELPQRTDLFSMINAVTSWAKNTVPSRRIELESIAGDLLHRHVGRA